MSTRPKEQRGSGRSTRTPAQPENINPTTPKRGSKKPEKHTPAEVENTSNGISSSSKTLQKSPRVRQSKNNPADVTDTSNHLPSGKRKTDKGVSPCNDNIVQLTVSVSYPVDSKAATGKKPSTKLNKSKSQDLEADTGKDQSAITKTIDKRHKLSHDKSNSDLGEDGQHQAKVATKKACGKTSKEKKLTSNLDNEVAPEPKGKDAKAINSTTPRRLKDVLDGKLRMKMEDISNAAEKVNKVLDKILKSEQFKEDPLFKNVEKMSTGSYYERLKISKPNEFDIMLKISHPSYNTIHLTNFDQKGPFYTMAYKDRKPRAMGDYVDPEGNISARKIVQKFRNLIKDVISGMEGVTLMRKSRGSPAVTLSIKNEPEDISVDLVIAYKLFNKWPEETNDGMNIDEWLGVKVKQDLKKSNFYMVPKQAMIGNKPVDADTWRISFSNIEKEILNNHGHVKTCCEAGGHKCCRKPCLKLMKYLLELLKNSGKQKKMGQFCSYHAKTALLHHCTKYPKDEDWKFEDLDSCFDRYVSFFLDCLRRCTLYNFFIPSHNMFSAEFVDKSNCDYLYKVIEKQKTSSYPMFYE